MTDLLIAFIAALGAGTFTYTRFARTTGYGNAKNAIIGALLVTAVAFVLMLTIIKLTFPE